MATTRNVGSTWGRRRDAIVQSLRDTRAELKKVTWPSRQETTNLTLVVIGISVALGLVLGGVDLALSEVFRWLTNTVGGGAGL
jgi:preprotein translocase subunit SecE